MWAKRKKGISFVALLLAVLTILPMDTVNAAVSTASGTEDSAVYWSTVLPTDGDRSYRSDSKWYRLVLEFGSYSSNSVDSDGNYADTSPQVASSWPSKIWNNYYETRYSGKADKIKWLGSKQSELVLNGTIQREADMNLYRGNEYSQDGMYSLYIKYAGKSKKTGEDCWYISPCDENGDRAEKLWALDCCLDTCKDDIGKSLSAFFDYGVSSDVQESNIIKPISEGLTPIFTLLSPSFDEFETSDNFKYAGMALPDYKNNNGSILADYIDNHKWIISRNSDGSWAVKSAGYIDWNWTDANGTFVKMFGDPAKALANGLARYAQITAYQMYDEDSIDADLNIILGHGYTNVYYRHPWEDDELMDYEIFGENSLNAIPFAEMVFLTDYAENVYITGGYAHIGTQLLGKTRNAGQNVFSTLCAGFSLPSGMYYASYGMQMNNTLTEKELARALEEYEKDRDNGTQKSYYPAEKMGIKTYTTAETGSAEGRNTYLTVEEIKKTLPISMSSCWQPSAKEGAFSAVYVGATLSTEVYDAQNESAAIRSGTTVVLGDPDKNSDGVCDGAAHIGTLTEYSIQSGSGTRFGPSVVVEKGGVLQIDGPTYAAAGTSLTVKGSLIINAGAMLCVEDMESSRLGGVSLRGISLNVDGGSVYISRGAMLDIGFADLTLTNGGSLVNNGVFVQDTEDNGQTSFVNLKGGTIENSRSGYFISGAEITGAARQYFLGMTTRNAPFMELIAYLTNVDDFMLNSYLVLPYESFKDETVINFRMYPSDSQNLFRNLGTSVIPGAIKGICGDSQTAGTIMDGGKIYRGRDLYALGLNNAMLGWSFTYTRKQCNWSKSDVYDDFYITLYNNYYGISYSESGVNTDNTGETVAEKYNLFALRVGTGAQGTEKISNFGVCYVDRNGTERTEYISPGDLSGTYEFLLNWKYCGTGQNESGSSRLKNYGAKGGAMSENSFSDTLEPLSSKVFLFQTLYPLDYVKSISFAGAGSGSWTCTELSVYRVSYLYPLEEYGWRSESWYVPFSGSLIAETALKMGSDGVSSTTFNWDSETVTIGTDSYQLNVYSVPKSVETQKGSSGFYNVSHEKKPYSTQNREYTFSVSLADARGAGIEAFYANSVDFTLNELISSTAQQEKISNVRLNLELTYIDTNGSARRITLPMLQSAVEWAYANCDDSSRNAPVHGLFQQGEKIAFRGTLPDFSSGVEATLSYNDAYGGDSLAVASLTISNADYVNVRVSDGMLRLDYPESAVSFYCASDTRGVYINNGQSMNVTLKKWNGTESLKPKAKGSRYLVVVRTDSMAEAGTVNDISVSFNYKQLTGVTASSQAYSLNSLVDDYYGYWLSSDGRDSNCAYKTAVSAGGQMYFVVDISNLYQFVSATFTMAKPDKEAGAEGADNGDEWQMSGITIYELEELGERRVILGAGVSLSDTSTNRTYYRDNLFGSRGAINSAKGPLMIGPGESKTIDFEEGNVTGGGEAVEKNIINDATELSYEDTKQNFGFNTRRAKYTVNVQVAGESITSAEDGDCGSKNQFYFQLVFEDEDGMLCTSPCVLANQQLKSDGFRTGTLEEFVIYTNDDYGTPVQVNVIPDDTSTTSDVFDKLNIEYISVNKTSGTGVNLSWKAENVGWIDIEYRDDAEAQSGRTNDELIRSFELKESGYSVQIEFGIETAGDYVDDRQFVGQLLADITYRDRSGAIQTKYNVDVVSKMAEYAQRSSDLPDARTSGTTTSLEDFMFKNGYTNRFLVEFDDISSLTKIRFKVTPVDDVTWKVAKVFARQVFNSGTLSFNIFNEYERYYSVEPQDLTASNNARVVSIEAPEDDVTYATFNFNSGNSIVIDLTEDAESVNVAEGYSEGINDSIGITVELTDTTGIAAGTGMPVKVMYKNIYGDAYAVSANLVFDAQTGKFMIPQNSLPLTPNIGMPYQVELSGGSLLGGRGLEAVTVNQIRDRQAIEQFVFVPDTGTKLDASTPVTILLSESEQDKYAERMGYTTMSQLVYLQLGAATEKTLLSETQDLQVALVYSEKNDPYSFEHVSEYASALDSGYTVIDSGSVLKLPMSVGNLGSVKSIMLRTSGERMKVNVSKACISIEETSNLSGDRLSTGWVNLPAETAKISTEGTAMNTDGATPEQALVSNTRISPINATAHFSGIERSDATIRLTIYYLDMQNGSHTLSCEHSLSDWNRNGAWFLADGLKTIQYYKLETYDKDASYTAAVSVDELSLNWYGTDGTKSTSRYTGATKLVEGESVSNAMLSATLTGTVSSADGTQMATLENNTVVAGRTEYQTLTLNGNGTVNVNAVLSGYPGELELSVVNEASGESLYGTVSSATTLDVLSYSFTLPVNGGTETMHYTLSIRAKNLSDRYSAKINIDVEPTVFMEGLVFGPDNSRLADFLTLTGNTNLAFFDRLYEPGETITVYVRTANDANPLLMTSSPTDGSAFTVSSVADVTLAGYDGTWTQYTLTMSTPASPTACSFALTSVRSSDAHVTLSFAVNAPASEPEP